MASSVGPDATASLIELVMMEKLENPRKKSILPPLLALFRLL